MKIFTKLPFPKSWTVDGPKVYFRPGQVTLEYDYLHESEEAQWVKIEFTNVIAFRFIEEIFCGLCLDFVGDGLITLNVEESQWLRQLKGEWDKLFQSRNSQSSATSEFHFQHFGVWFNDEGCYEIVAREFSISTHS